MAWSFLEARALKQALSLVFLTAAFSVALSGHKGVSAHIDIQLPKDIPAALNNFTTGYDNCTDFLRGVFVGIGHQKYTFNGTAWINSNVSAILYDQNVTKVAHHFFLAPPGLGGGVATWAMISPRSSVTASPAVKIPQKDAVPLLLLHATATRGSNSTSDSFAEVTHVQRLQTRGGLPPPTINATTGDTFLSKYSAIYAFYHVG